MIPRLDLQQLTAPRRAALIYSHVHSQMTDRLWHAALGDVLGLPDDPATGIGIGTGTGIDSLLGLMAPATAAGVDAPPPVVAIAPPPPHVTTDVAADGATSDPAAVGQISSLGPNDRYRGALTHAATRTGIPAAALAAIIGAEAARAPDGSWKTHSRNTRSSAAGLGQFLSGTWQGMAEMKGTWLNGVARTQGWIGAGGKVSAESRSALLALRYDATASINTIADYAHYNIEGLRRRGVAVGSGSEAIARTAYVGHHLGLADAARFLSGGLNPAHAGTLLAAQIGAAKAGERIAQAGNGAAAHRAWFTAYMNHNLRPDRFSA